MPPRTDKIRVGIIGLESSHVDHFVRHLNVEQRWDGVRVSALVGGESPRAADLCVAGGVYQVVPSPIDLIGQVDAAIISTRDGARHAAEALRLLSAGIAAFVDKPFATTVADAQAMITAARRGTSLLYSTSPLRTTPEMLPLIGSLDHDGPYESVRVSGPADPDSPYSGLAFYGIHLIEAGLALCPPDLPDAVVVHHDEGAIAATSMVGATELVLNFQLPRTSGAVPIQVEVSRGGRTTCATLTRGPDLHLPTLTSFITMLRTNTPPRTDDDLLRPVRLLEAICAAL